MSLSGRKSDISAVELQGRIDRGQGEGSLQNFLSWHTTANSKGPGHKGKFDCKLTGRPRYYLSETEEGTIYSVMRDRYLQDARENHRLPIGLTSQVCKGLGVKHPQSTGPGTPLIPYTTDLLLTRSQEPTRVALYCRLRSSLRTLTENKSLLVEHATWALLGVPLLVVTDLEITKNSLESLRFLRPEKHLAEFGSDQEQRATFLRHASSADWSYPLIEVVRRISALMGIDSDKGLELFKALVWNKSLNCDMERGISVQTRNAVSTAAHGR